MRPVPRVGDAAARRDNPLWLSFAGFARRQGAKIPQGSFVNDPPPMVRTPLECGRDA